MAKFAASLEHHERPADGEPAGALVFFHGYYGLAEDFLPFMDKIDPARRFHAFLPQAPHVIAEGRGSWIDPASEMTPDLEPVIAWLDSLPFALDRCVLGGWSQGTAIAYAAGLLGGRRRPAAILALGGRMLEQPSLDLSPPLPPVLIAHGRADEAVPVEAAREARDLLVAAGAPVTYLETAVGHLIDPDTIPRVRAFLDSRSAAQALNADS